MLRKILIIILLAVVIIAAIFAIQWFLNRDSGDEAETPLEDGTTVVDEGGASTSDDVDGEGSVDETQVDEIAEPSDQTTTDATIDGDGATDGYPDAGTDGTGDEVASVDEDGSTDSATTDETTDSGDAAQGGVADGTDPNAGGGGSADNTDTLGDTVAVEPGAEGTGGLGDTPAISQPIAFVQPGVPTQHTAANQEWLTQLARCYGTTVADIQAANNYACPDLIHAGYVININNPGNAGPITVNDQPCFVYYTVQQGDTLYSIANMYGINHQWLARINAIYNYNYVYAGQQLVIPNPVDPVFTQPPAEPFFYSNCWYNCPVYPVQPIYPVPYGQQLFD